MLKYVKGVYGLYIRIIMGFDMKTRTEKIAALVKEIVGTNESKADDIKQGILAGVRLRDEELLEDKPKEEQLDVGRDWSAKDKYYYPNSAVWQMNDQHHEVVLELNKRIAMLHRELALSTEVLNKKSKAIKGDGDVN